MGVVLYVVCRVVHMFTDVLISHFEVIAFVCDEWQEPCSGLL